MVAAASEAASASASAVASAVTGVGKDATGSAVAFARSHTATTTVATQLSTTDRPGHTHAVAAMGKRRLDDGCWEVVKRNMIGPYGWQSAVVKIMSGGTTVYSSYLPSGMEVETDQVCGLDNGCYTVLATEGGYWEVYWLVYTSDDSSSPAATGGALESAEVCVGMPSFMPTTLSPTMDIPTREKSASTFTELKDSIASNTVINVLADMVFTHAITITGVNKLTISSEVNAVFDGQNQNGLFVVGESDLTFTGVTFARGRKASTISHGGCVEMEEYGAEANNVVFIDATFESCSASRGGAISVSYGSSVLLLRSTLRWCSANYYGGGLFLSSSYGYDATSVVEVVDSAFESCSVSAGTGGAVHITLAAPMVLTMNRTVLKSCSASQGGGGVKLDGTSATNPFNATFDHVTFDSCTCSVSAYSDGGGGLLMVGHIKAYLLDTSFLACSTSGSGGAMFARESDVTMTRTHAKSCSSQKGGGGYYFYGDVFNEYTYTLTMIDSSIQQCSATGTGSESEGGGLFAVNSVVNMIKSDIESCQAEGEGGGISLSGEHSELVVLMLRAKGNVPNDLYTTSLSYTCTTECTAGHYSNCSIATGSGVYDPTLRPCYVSCSACEQCQPGKAGASDGAASPSQCVACGTGLISEAGATSCTGCDAGHFATRFNDTTLGEGDVVISEADTCESCPAGYYAKNSYSIACVPCTSGTFSDSGANSCTSWLVKSAS